MEKEMPTKNTNLQKALLEFEERLLAWLKLEESLSQNNRLFKIIAEPKKWTIIFLGNAIPLGFIRNLALPLNQATAFQIRQTKSYNKAILTGIATNAVIGKTNPHWNKECLAYQSDGYLYENGSGHKVGREVADGEVIAVRVDTANWQIKWNVGS